MNHDDPIRQELIERINQMCNLLDVSPWELDCFNKHECERWD